uniref:Cyclin C-terminal domain-containing protein n=1 Tax=Setaria italica TaxID=4555 RepID=K3Y1Q0_SETIT
MSPRFDFAASMLLCSEDSTTIFDLEEEEESKEISWVLGSPSRHVDASSGSLLIDFPLQSESFIEELLGREEKHLPMEGYAQRLLQQPGGSDLVAVRNAAIDWIWKVHDHYKLGPLTAVLSVNYLDRFLSLCDFAVVDAEYVFDPPTVHRMEHAVLNTLSWRMQAVTACSFVDYYLHKFSDGDAVSEITLARSIELILSASKAAELMVFRPSEIAASVALVALGKHDSSVLESVATSWRQLIKERVLGCCEVIQEKIVMGNIILKSIGSSVFTEQHRPIGVLDVAACESQQSEGISSGVPIINNEGPSASKRRRICT